MVDEHALPERTLAEVAIGLVRENRMHPWGLHGLAHWWRVRHNGLLMAGEMGANPRVVKLFALFHDSHRESDGYDLDHGPRAAAWLAKVREDLEGEVCGCAITRGVIGALSEAEFEALHAACDLHTRATHHDDPTVATCFVADRLDLSRVGYRPDPSLMPAPAKLLPERFIDEAMARERAGLGWPGGMEITSVWGVRV